MLKKIFLLFFINLVFSIECFASYEDRLFELEKLRYGKNFQNESISERLLRLEEDYFGMTQAGDINSRINMLMQIAKNNYPNQFSYDRKSYSPRQKKGGVKNFLKDLASTFIDSGSMTGYIPPMNTYDDFYHNSTFDSNYYDRFFTPPKYSPNYVPPHSHRGYNIHHQMASGYNPGYSTSTVQYDSFGNPTTFNRDLYARSAVKILRD